MLSLLRYKNASVRRQSAGSLAPLVRGAAVAGLCCALAFLAGCTGGQAARPFTVANGGYVHRGKQLIGVYGCGRCHTIPGVAGADGVFGPPLMKMAARTYIAGNFPNQPETLARWIESPQSMKPKTAMPDLGVTPEQARDITAYLETLR